MMTIPDNTLLFSLDIGSIPFRVVSVISIVVLGYTLIQDYLVRRRLPPGPVGLPFVGNALQMDKYQWVSFQKWKRQYGDIFSLNLLGQRVIVLSSLKTATELLDQRSNIYSGRPRWIIGNEILTGNMFFALIPRAGHQWKKFRKAAQEFLGTRATRSYQPLQEKQAFNLVTRILKDPQNWANHFYWSVALTMLSVIYGWSPLDPRTEEYARRIHEYTVRLENVSTPGRYLVESFPWMLHLPSWMAKWKREAMEWYRKDTALFKELVDGVEAKMREGKSEPCFAASLLENTEKYELSRLETTWLAGSMFGVGIDTSATTLEFLTLAMVLYPEIMHRAQEELDAVVGRDRMPTFADREHLPYIGAIVREVLRWRPVGPAGLAKVATEDDWYDGYFIPKGTIVLPNIWALNRDPTMYPNPEKFSPERYLDAKGNLVDPLPDTHGEGHLSFGFGRRICAGKDLANQTVFFHAAVLLWAFTFDKARDETGAQMTPLEDGFKMNGIILRPAEFRCVFRPRFADVGLVVERLMSA